MRLHLAGTVLCLGIGPRRTVHRQPVLRRAQNSACETARPAASPCLLSHRHSGARVSAMPRSDAREKVLLWDQRDSTCPVLPEKRNRFALPPNQLHNSRRPVPLEGRFAIVTDVGAGCGGRGSVGRANVIAGSASAGERSRARRRTALKRTAKPCGPGTRCWCQVGGGFASPTGFTQNR